MGSQGHGYPMKGIVFLDESCLSTLHTHHHGYERNCFEECWISRLNLKKTGSEFRRVIKLEIHLHEKVFVIWIIFEYTKNNSLFRLTINIAVKSRMGERNEDSIEESMFVWKKLISTFISKFKPMLSLISLRRLLYTLDSRFMAVSSLLTHILIRMDTFLHSCTYHITESPLVYRLCLSVLGPLLYV